MFTVCYTHSVTLPGCIVELGDAASQPRGGRRRFTRSPESFLRPLREAAGRRKEGGAHTGRCWTGASHQEWPPFRAQLRWTLLAPTSHSAWVPGPPRCPCDSLCRHRVAPRATTEVTPATPAQETGRHSRRRTGLHARRKRQPSFRPAEPGGGASGGDTRSSQKATRGVSEAQAWLRPR